MRKMDRNQHSVYLLYYHLIMVVKYRRNVIDDQISERGLLEPELLLDNNRRSDSRSDQAIYRKPGKER